MPKKLNTQYGGRTSFALIQQQSSVPLTFPSIPVACHYILMLAQRPKDAPAYEHEASSLQFKASTFHSFGPHAPPAALYSLVEWKRTSGGSELCAAMGLLRWSIIYYSTRISAEWQMPVREMGPGRSELGYWPQHPRQTEGARAYKDSLWWQVAVFAPVLNLQITHLPQLHEYSI